MPTSSPRALTGTPVSRLVSPVVSRLVLLVTLVAAVGVVGVLLSLQSTARLTDGVAPVQRAQERLAVDVADLQAAVDGYLRSGADAELTAVQRLHGRVDRETVQLTGLADDADDAPLTALVQRETTAVDGWLTDYVDRQVVVAVPVAGAGPLYTTGRSLYADYTDARGAAQSALDDRISNGGSAAVLRLRLTVVGILLLLGLSWVLIGRARARLLRELSEPLTRLEAVVARMLRNDPEGRADQDTGPKEVRAIARALNDFAAAQSRARAVEGRIQDELHVLDSAKDDFVSNVSHELRTPLTTISGYLEMVVEEFEGRLEPRHERMLVATRRNVTRLRALIDDLLALSRAENRPSPELEAADVTELVREAVTDVRMTASRRDVVVELTAPPAPMLVTCDRAMLYRAFLNVLTNAVKFSHEHTTVQVSVRRLQDRVEVAVRDHGIGIPRAEIDRLGTRFFRASNAMSNEIAGTGLGLRIVRTIIDKHDGDVVIESAEGFGTTVYVRLDLQDGRRAPVVVLGEPAEVVGEVRT